MDIQGLFSVSGRYGRSQFWWSWGALVGISLLVSWLPLMAAVLTPLPAAAPLLSLFGGLATIVIFYCQTCITAKRLHDMHRTGWIQTIPMVVCVLAGIGGGMLARLSGEPRVVEIAGILVTVIGAVFLIWIGLTPSDKETNRFGPPTGRLAAAEAFA